MRLSHRLISLAVLAALSSALGGCSGGGLGNWDPTDMLDFLDTKKKLPGERKDVFPGGVPGLEQGVPKDMYKGAAEQPPPPTADATAPVQPEPKGKKSKQKRNAATAPAAAPAGAAEPSAEEDGGAAAAPPPPKQAKTSRRRITTPPPDQPADQSQPGFQAPVPSGSFQR